MADTNVDADFSSVGLNASCSATFSNGFGVEAATVGGTCSADTVGAGFGVVLVHDHTAPTKVNAPTAPAMSPVRVNGFFPASVSVVDTAAAVSGVSERGRDRSRSLSAMLLLSETGPKR